MTLLKIPFIVADGMWMSLSATPPNEALPKEDHIIPDWKERFLKSLATPCVALRVSTYVLNFTTGPDIDRRQCTGRRKVSR